MERRTWEDIGIGVGALALIGGGVYIHTHGDNPPFVRSE